VISTSTTVVGIATARAPDTATRDLEGFVVAPSTTAKWASTGGPSIATGYFAMVFRAMRSGLMPQSGVTALRMTTPIPDNDFYFDADETTRGTIDVTATATGANGTALVTGASLADGAYTGTGGLPAECRWSAGPGVTLPGVVFIQIFRPEDATGMTCPR
jgi:hypothetical protein